MCSDSKVPIISGWGVQTELASIHLNNYVMRCVNSVCRYGRNLLTFSTLGSSSIETFTCSSFREEWVRDSSLPAEPCATKGLKLLGDSGRFCVSPM
jgi:hypothetical protein